MPRVKLMRNPAEDAIADEIRRNYGGMLSVNDLMRFLNVNDRRTAQKFVSDVPYYDVNGRRKWMASDVARKVAEVRSI